MNVCERFDETMRANAERPALIGGLGKDRRVLSYASLKRCAEAVSAQFHARGLRPGDRVLLAVPLSIETYIVMLALLRSGLVVTFVDPAHGFRRVAGILEAWPPDAIVTTRAAFVLRFAVPPLRRIPQRFFVGGRPADGETLSLEPIAAVTLPPVARSPADSALLTFTSGSTGEPKPVIRTHGFLCRQLEVLGPVAALRQEDIDFTAMPMFVLFNLASGISSVIPASDIKSPARADPELLWSQLRLERASRMVASPALLESLVDWCRRHRQGLPHLSVVCTGGGPVRPALADRLRQVAPRARLRMVYGSTEAEPIAVIDDRDVSVDARHRMRNGEGLLVGRPVAGCEVRIVDPRQLGDAIECDPARLAELTCRVGQVGEIIVSGRHVLSGYADAARNRGTKIDVDGRRWHRTGDAGYLDDAGLLWLVGRCGAAIRDDRGTVYPFQVEFALAGATGIRRAALVERHGHRTLVLETRGRRFESGCETLGRCIARHGIDRIITVRHIPMDRRHDAKIDYPALRSLLEGRRTILMAWAADVASTAWRYLQRVIRHGRYRCHAARAATTLEECHPGTDQRSPSWSATGESGSASSLPLPGSRQAPGTSPTSTATHRAPGSPST